ncbi:PhoH family protein [Candidatus Calescamantes bacterium]|nr:PhoH family protein [Candidatus Calescamantes bacterium]
MSTVVRQLPPITQLEVLSLLGGNDRGLKLLEKEFNVKIIGRGGRLSIRGEEEDVEKAMKAIKGMLKEIRRGRVLQPDDLEKVSKDVKEGKEVSLIGVEVYSGRIIRPKNPAQEKYIKAILENEIVFAIGPAGTGKTYLAMAMAVNFLKEKMVNRVILVRPAVEAGEKLGYLPGDIYQKIAPYLRPLYDALYDMMEADRLKEYVDRGIIEIAPLAYMRGRTFNDSFIVLDEAQNSTPEQMKMFLTRLGFDSKVVITGDITQVDLPKNVVSGLIHAERILKEIKGITFFHFTEKDVVRHPLVQEIVLAYERAKKKEEKNTENRERG